MRFHCHLGKKSAPLTLPASAQLHQAAIQPRLNKVFAELFTNDAGHEVSLVVLKTNSFRLRLGGMLTRAELGTA